MNSPHAFTVNLTLLEGHAFKVDFGDMDDILTARRGAAAGNGERPNPSRLLAAAVGNCRKRPATKP